jgi:hypothetical protein
MWFPLTSVAPLLQLSLDLLQQTVFQPGTHHRLIAPALFARGLDILLEPLVCLRERPVHLNRCDFFLVWRQRVGNILERNERAELPSGNLRTGVATRRVGVGLSRSWIHAAAWTGKPA